MLQTRAVTNPWIRIEWNLSYILVGISISTRIPEIQLSEIHEISSISVRFLEILLVLDEFQDVSLNSVGFQKNSKYLTDIGENF